jgi:transposase
MAMGNDKRGMQQPLFIEASALPHPPGHPFYERLNALLDLHGFSSYVEERCVRFYADEGRPSIPPVVYFKMLLVGYFEGLDSERGIAWRAKDSLCLREFLGYALTESPPDHSSLSRTRHRIDLETHRDVFQWVLTLLARDGLVQAKTVGVDSTTLEANAAMRTIVRRDTAESYEEFLTGLAQASGIETPTRQDLATIDKTRKNKASNKDWTHPYDPDARITKMKDGTTHLAHKAEHAVDMDTGALLAVALHPADHGDAQTLEATLEKAEQNVEQAAQEKDARRMMHETPLCEVVADKGYHSNDTLASLTEDQIRTYISEPARGRRAWAGKPEPYRHAVYANRRRIKAERGKRLLRKRGELIERSFAHCYETGAMRRLYLNGRDNILKRLLIHTAAFNLGLVIRTQAGAGTPRQLAEALAQGLKEASKLIQERLSFIIESLPHLLRNKHTMKRAADQLAVV